MTKVNAKVLNMKKSLKIRINTSITGEPAKWLCEWKRRGLVTSNTDAVIQAFRIFQERITEHDLKSIQVENLRKIEKE